MNKHTRLGVFTWVVVDQLEAGDQVSGVSIALAWQDTGLGTYAEAIHFLENLDLARVIHYREGGAVQKGEAYEEFAREVRSTG